MIQVVCVRAAIVSDLSVVAHLCELVNEIHYRNRPDMFKNLTAAELKLWFEEIFHDTTRQIWVAEVHGVIVGYALTAERHMEEQFFTRELHWLEIEQLSVRPDYRRQGIAGALIKQIRENHTANSGGSLQLNSYAFNETAFTAFSRLGFVARNSRFEYRAERPQH